jgi:hypothetical protein
MWSTYLLSWTPYVFSSSASSTRFAVDQRRATQVEAAEVQQIERVVDEPAFDASASAWS